LALVTIKFRMLPGEAAAATKFLQSKLQSEVQVRGKVLEIDDKRANEVKFLLKKFLYREGFSGYRVHSESGVVRIVPHDPKQLHDDSRDEDKVKVFPHFLHYPQNDCH